MRRGSGSNMTERAGSNPRAGHHTLVESVRDRAAYQLMRLFIVGASGSIWAASAMDAVHRSAPALVPSNTLRLDLRSAIHPIG